MIAFEEYGLRSRIGGQKLDQPKRRLTQKLKEMDTTVLHIIFFVFENNHEKSLSEDPIAHIHRSPSHSAYGIFYQTKCCECS